MIVFIDEDGSTPPAVVTWNPADKNAGITLSSGDLRADHDSAGGTGFQSVRATKGIPATGKGCFELVMTFMNGGGPYTIVGIAQSSASLSNYPGADAVGWGYYADTGEKVTNGVTSAFGAGFRGVDVVTVAIDNGNVWFAKNGTWQGGGDPATGTSPAFTGLSGTLFPMVAVFNPGGTPDAVTAHFTSTDFSYSGPAGFVAWDAA